MTFTYDGADLSSTIKTFVYENGKYHVFFLDGSDIWYDATDVEKEKLRNLMLEQAIDRDAKMQLELLQLKRLLIRLVFAFSCFSIVLSASRRNELTTILSLLLNGISLSKAYDIEKVINELKKYKMFMDIMEDLDRINDGEILESSDGADFHQPLNLENLDKYTYNDMKRIRQLIPFFAEKK